MEYLQPQESVNAIVRKGYSSGKGNKQFNAFGGDTELLHRPEVTAVPLGKLAVSLEVNGD